MSIDPNIDSAPAQRKNIKGHTTIQAKALTSVATLVTAEMFGVHPDKVEASIHDDNTKLGLSMTTPLKASDVERTRHNNDVTVFSLCDTAREKIAEKTRRLTGHTIGEVHLVINGIEHQQGRQLQ